MRRFLPVVILLLVVVPSVLGQQAGARVADLQARVVDLIFRTEDLAGGAGDIGGKVEDLQVRETATEVVIDLAADVLFEFDKAVILPKAENTLKKAAKVIRERSQGVVSITGHTDSRGDDSYNLRLSRQRADSVRNWFAQKAGLGTIRFTTEGMGEKQPVAPNEKSDGSDDPENRQKNRRVNIVIKKG